MKKPLEGIRHALVVGPGGGIGSALVGRLGSLGIAVSGVGRSRPERFEGWFGRFPDLADVRWGDAYRDAEGAARAPIEAVIYVAGDAVFGRATAVPTARARQVFESNFWSPVAAAVAASEHWAAPRRGVFVSVSSISARRAVPFEAHYCASKAACARFLDAMDLEYPDRRLRFLSVYPGRLRTAFRSKAEWHGLPAPPSPGGGRDPGRVASAIVRILAARRGAPVLGPRERAIDLADRVSPSIYDRLVLDRRVARLLRSR